MTDNTTAVRNYENAGYEFINKIFSRRPEIDIKTLEHCGYSDIGYGIKDLIVQTRSNGFEVIEIKGSILVDINEGSKYKSGQMNRVKLRRKDIDDLPTWFLFVFDTSQFGQAIDMKHTAFDFRYMLLPGETISKLVNGSNGDIMKLPFPRLIKAFKEWKKPNWLLEN